MSTRLKGGYWYDTNYFCSKCRKFYPRQFLRRTEKGKPFCGICLDARNKARLQRRGKRFEGSREHYNEVYHD